MNQLKHYREKAGLGRADLATLVGLKTKGAIGHYENGIRTPPLATARKLVSVLNKRGADCTLDKVFPPTKKRRGAI